MENNTNFHGMSTKDNANEHGGHPPSKKHRATMLYNCTNALTAALYYCPEVFTSSELGDASQICRDTHKPALREAKSRLEAIGWKNSLPYGLDGMGIFPRVATIRILEGLVVGCCSSSKRLRHNLGAMGAHVVHKETFAEAIMIPGMDFCVWSSSKKTPTLRELLSDHFSNKTNARPPVVVSEYVLEVFLFSPWVADVDRQYFRGEGLSVDQIAEILKLNTNNPIFESDLPGNVLTENAIKAHDDFQIVSYKSFINAKSGDMIRHWEFEMPEAEWYVYERRNYDDATEDDAPFLCLTFLRSDFPGVVASWIPPVPQMGEAYWVEASVHALYSNRPDNFYEPPCMLAWSWTRNFSSTKEEVSDRLSQWRSRLQELIDYGELSCTGRQMPPEIYGLNHWDIPLFEELPRSCAVGAAILSWAWAQRYEFDDDFDDNGSDSDEN